MTLLQGYINYSNGHVPSRPRHRRPGSSSHWPSPKARSCPRAAGYPPPGAPQVEGLGNGTKCWGNAGGKCWGKMVGVFFFLIDQD